MNQPNSLQSVGAKGLAGTSSFGDANAIPLSPVLRSGIISINAGSTALKQLISNPHLSQIRIIALDERPFSFPGGVDLIQVPVDEKSNAAMVEQVGPVLTIKQTKEAITAISGLDVIFVLVRLGEAGILSSAITIAEALLVARIPAFGIAMLPFGFSKLSDPTNESVDLKTLGRCLTTFPVSQEDLVRSRLGETEIDIDKNMTPNLIEQVLSVPREDIPTAIERIVYAVSAPKLCETMVSYDFSDVVATLDCSALASIGYGSSSDSQGLGCAMTDALDHPLLGRKSVIEASGILAIIESRTPADKMRIVVDAMQLLRDSVGDQCNVMFSLIIDKDLPSDYRVTIVAAHFDAKIAEARGVAIESNSTRLTGRAHSVEVSDAELDAATELIQNTFQPGMAIRGPVPFVQRHLRIGHQKASAIVQALEYAGIIAATAGEADSFSHRRVK